MKAVPDYQALELQQGLKQVQQQLQLLQQQKLELEQMVDTLQELKKTNTPHEILVPLGAGVFIKTNIKDTKTVILNVGSNIAVEKTVEDALALVEKQGKELGTIEHSMNEELAHMSQQLQFLQMSQHTQQEQ